MSRSRLADALRAAEDKIEAAEHLYDLAKAEEKRRKTELAAAEGLLRRIAKGEDLGPLFEELEVDDPGA